MQMNKKCVAVIAASLVAATLVAGCGTTSTEKKPAENKDQKVLRVGTEPTFPPFESAEGDKYVGFDIDYSEAIAKKMGMNLEVRSMGFDALIPALKSGQIDMIAAGLIATPERRQQVLFTDVYFHGGYVIVVRKDNNEITDWESLKGKTVGVQVGIKAIESIEGFGGTVKQYDANSQGWMELRAKTCDAVVIDKAVAGYNIAHGAEDLKIVGRLLPNDGSAFAVSKDHPELLEKVNKAISELKADGTYAKLYKKWFGEEPPTGN